MQHFGSFIFLLVISLIGKHKSSFTLPKQACQCAKVPEEDTTEWERKHDSGKWTEQHRRFKRKAKNSTKADNNDDTEDDDRIVGGYDVKINKPWVVRLWWLKQDFLCGGALINKRFVLTAGHCVCNNKEGLPCDKQGKPKYDVSENWKAYLGVNRKEVDYLNRDLKGNQQYEYGIEDGMANPKYMINEATQDIALFKIDRDVKFRPNVLQPICLPTTFDKSDVAKTGQENMVYISGWGRLWGGKCITTELGPQRQVKCNFGPQKNQYQCSTSRTPSAKDKDCKGIWKQDKDKYPKAPGDVISLLMPDKKEKKCYARSGDAGWCYTVGEAEEGQDWGFCQDHCKYMDGSEKFAEAILASKLQETKLHILTMIHCKTLITNRKYDFRGKFEFCAGRKKKFRNVEQYEKKGGKYVFKSKTKNFLGLDKDRKYPYDYYVSSSDTCSGDSGGGVYQWRDGTPTLIGIVSRGWGSNNENGCAEMNYPGIYTRVMKYLEWIYENSKSGNC